MQDFIQQLLKIALLPMDDVSGLLTFDQSTINIISVVWDYFLLLAYGLTIIYFLIEVNKRWAFEGADLTIKTFFIPFMKLAIAILIISQAERIFAYIINFNNTLVTYKWSNNVSTIKGSLSYSDFPTSLIGNLGLIDRVIFVIPCLMLMIVNGIISLVFRFKAIMFKLEFLFRLGITPIALTDIYSGQNSAASRWVRGFIALIIYGVSFSIIPYIGTAIALDPLFKVELGNIWELIRSVIFSLVVPIAELGILNVAKSATREALGA